MIPRAVQPRNFIEMTGRTCGSWTVIERAREWDVTAQWRCRHSCGAVHILSGVVLRGKPPKTCPDCRVKKASAAE